jgi:hypothetical protein
MTSPLLLMLRVSAHQADICVPIPRGWDADFLYDLADIYTVTFFSR